MLIYFYIFYSQVGLIPDQPISLMAMEGKKSIREVQNSQRQKRKSFDIHDYIEKFETSENMDSAGEDSIVNGNNKSFFFEKTKMFEDDNMDFTCQQGIDENNENEDDASSNDSQLNLFPASIATQNLQQSLERSKDKRTDVSPNQEKCPSEVNGKPSWYHAMLEKASINQEKFSKPAGQRIMLASNNELNENRDGNISVYKSEQWYREMLEAADSRLKKTADDGSQMQCVTSTLPKYEGFMNKLTRKYENGHKANVPGFFYNSIVPTLIQEKANAGDRKRLLLNQIAEEGNVDDHPTNVSSQAPIMIVNEKKREGSAFSIPASKKVKLGDTEKTFSVVNEMSEKRVNVLGFEEVKSRLDDKENQSFAMIDGNADVTKTRPEIVYRDFRESHIQDFNANEKNFPLAPEEERMINLTSRQASNPKEDTDYCSQDGPRESTSVLAFTDKGNIPRFESMQSFGHLSTGNQEKARYDNAEMLQAKHINEYQDSKRNLPDENEMCESSSSCANQDDLGSQNRTVVLSSDAHIAGKSEPSILEKEEVTDFANNCSVIGNNCDTFADKEKELKSSKDDFPIEGDAFAISPDIDFQKCNSETFYIPKRNGGAFADDISDAKISCPIEDEKESRKAVKRLKETFVIPKMQYNTSPTADGQPSSRFSIDDIKRKARDRMSWVSREKMIIASTPLHPSLAKKPDIPSIKESSNTLHIAELDTTVNIETKSEAVCDNENIKGDEKADFENKNTLTSVKLTDEAPGVQMHDEDPEIVGESPLKKDGGNRVCIYLSLVEQPS